MQASLWVDENVLEVDWMVMTGRIVVVQPFEYTKNH
jgi:hypothetical protein